MSNEGGPYGHMQSGLQLAAGVGLGFYAGFLLDGRFGTGHWLAIGGAGAGLAAGLYLLLRDAAALEREQAMKKKGGPPASS